MKVPLFEMSSSSSDIHAITKVINRGTFWAMGPEIEEFEKKLAKYIGTSYCVVFNSGTSALYSLLLAYGISKEDEVIVPSFTFISTPNNVVMVGAKPIFADIEPDTMGLNYDSVLSLITPKTKAIIIVHFAGMPARDTLKIKELAKEKGIYFFEDNAESMGSVIGTQKTGSIGNAGMLSFCQNKIITTGEGGAIVTNDKTIYEKLLLIRSHGRMIKDGTEKYVQLGYNFRMPTMCAALGISQLKKINYLIQERTKIAEKYNYEFSWLPRLSLIKNQVNQLYNILLPFKIDRDNLMKFLLRNNIGCKVYFKPCHLEEMYNQSNVPIVMTNKISDRILSIPIYCKMSIAKQRYVIRMIKRWNDEYV